MWRNLRTFFVGEGRLRNDRLLKPSLTIFVCLALALTFFHFETLNRNRIPLRRVFHDLITSGQHNAPYQYRVLVPFAVEVASSPVIKLLKLTDPAQAWIVKEFLYQGVQLVTMFALFIFFYLFLGNWFSEELALIGTLVLAGLHFYSFHAYFYQPCSSVNLMFLALYAHWSTQGHQKRLWVLSAVASLTRETSGIMAALFLCHHGFSKKSMLRVAPTFLCWLLVQVGLRLVFGLKHPKGGQAWHVTRDPHVFLWPIMMFSLMWLIPLLKFRSLPPYFQRGLVLFVLPITVANFSFGKIQEARLFLDLALVLIPATMYVLYPPSKTPKDAPLAA